MVHGARVCIVVTSVDDPYLALLHAREPLSSGSCMQVEHETRLSGSRFAGLDI